VKRPLANRNPSGTATARDLAAAWSSILRLISSSISATATAAADDDYVSPIL
jgi:hypothetical protein